MNRPRSNTVHAFKRAKSQNSITWEPIESLKSLKNLQYFEKEPIQYISMTYQPSQSRNNINFLGSRFPTNYTRPKSSKEIKPPVKLIMGKISNISDSQANYSLQLSENKTRINLTEKLKKACYPNKKEILRKNVIKGKKKASISINLTKVIENNDEVSNSTSKYAIENSSPTTSNDLPPQINLSNEKKSHSIAQVFIPSLNIDNSSSDSNSQKAFYMNKALGQLDAYPENGKLWHQVCKLTLFNINLNLKPCVCGLRGKLVKKRNFNKNK